MNLNYQTIEARLVESFQFVMPEKANRRSYSSTFSSILRDIESTFDSVMKQLIKKSSGTKYKGEILDHLEFLKCHCPDLEKLSVGFNSNFKTILPFERPSTDPPLWWTAYNKVKHEEVEAYVLGNLENTVKALAGLAILREMICDDTDSRIFHNIGLLYPANDPSISKNNKLFPTSVRRVRTNDR
jgi:hypothetical protein